jgi:FkbM family methyltransferase
MDIIERIAKLMVDSERFTMLEFGACDGYHTNQFLHMLRTLEKPFTYHAFEPERVNFETCMNATRKNEGFFQLWPLAVGAETGIKPFYVSSGQKKGPNGEVLDNYYGSSSIRAPKLVTSAWPDMKFRTDQADVTTLDDFAENHIDGTIDFIWADIQGAQTDLVLGGPKTFPRVRYLYVEYEGSEMYVGEAIGYEPVAALLPGFDVVEDYGGDILLKNRSFS